MLHGQNQPEIGLTKGIIMVDQHMGRSGRHQEPEWAFIESPNGILNMRKNSWSLWNAANSKQIKGKRYLLTGSKSFFGTMV